VIALVHYIFRKQFLALSFDHEVSPKSGFSVKWWDFLFYSLFGLAVTSFVEIGGVLLVFSYLIVPAVCANFLANRLKSMLLIGWIVATVSSAGGLYSSYKFDLPTGAAIVCVFGAILILCGIIARLKRLKSSPLTS
ncbi:MAG: hypothetical protein JWM04_1780, partial [Verrucomicrobiales bacterium]|nr:hypothetical protein [Verrucomicrobiales bacterium]